MTTETAHELTLTRPERVLTAPADVNVLADARAEAGCWKREPASAVWPGC